MEGSNTDGEVENEVVRQRCGAEGVNSAADIIGP